VTLNHTSDECVGRHDRPRRALDGKYLCGGCQDRLEWTIAELPAHYDELGQVLAVAGQAGQRVSGSASRPLPINTAVADHRHHIRAVLTSWARLVFEERGITPPADEVPAIAAFLVTHVDWCCGHDWVAELLSEVRRCSGRARALLDPDHRLPTGERCRVVPENGERCEGVISMVQGRNEQWTARCSVCGPQEPGPYLHDGLAGRWVTWERVQAYALTRHQVRIKGDAVRQWAARGHIKAMTEQGATWYELASVEKYLSERLHGKAQAS
jgi:hypothetical protein